MTQPKIKTPLIIPSITLEIIIPVFKKNWATNPTVSECLGLKLSGLDLCLRV